MMNPSPMKKQIPMQQMQRKNNNKTAPQPCLAELFLRFL